MADRREGLCEFCGREYPVWYAPNELWNRVMRYPDGREASETVGFVCMDCFALRAESLGVKPTAWVVSEGGGVSVHPELTERAELKRLRELLDMPCDCPAFALDTNLGDRCSELYELAESELPGLLAALVISEQQQKRLRDTLGKLAGCIAALMDNPDSVVAQQFVIEAYDEANRVLSPSTPEENKND